jgi:hypothetical protein
MNEPAPLTELAHQLRANQETIDQLNEEISNRVANFQTRLQAAQNQDAQLRQAILTAMEETGFTGSYEDKYIRMTYIQPTARTSIDMLKLQLEQPKIYQQYKKLTPVKSQVRVKRK